MTDAPADKLVETIGNAIASWSSEISIREHIADTLTEAGLVAEKTFQQRVAPWMDACFGPEISADKVELNDRFIEEALELVQASGYTAERAHALVDYTFGRPQGEINQEVGGVMVTLAAHCLAHGVDMHEAGETELARIWTKVEQIRAKQAAKPKHSALPAPAEPPKAWTEEGVRVLREFLDMFEQRPDMLRLVGFAETQVLIDAANVLNECRADSIEDSFQAMIAIDRAYISGVQAGYNFGISEDREGRDRCLESRRREISEVTKNPRSVANPKGEP